MREILFFTILNKISRLYVNTFLMAKVQQETGNQGYLIFCLVQYLCTFATFEMLQHFVKSNEKIQVSVGTITGIGMIIAILHYPSNLPVWSIAIFYGVAQAFAKRMVIIKKAVIKDRVAALEYYSRYGIASNIFDIVMPIFMGYIVGEKIWQIRMLSSLFVITLFCQIALLARIKVRETDNKNKKIIEHCNIDRKSLKIYVMVFMKGFYTGLNRRANQIILLSVASGSAILGQYKSLLGVVSVATGIIIRFLVKKEKINRIIIRLSLIIVMVSTISFYMMPSIVTLVCQKFVSSSVMKLVELLADTKRLSELNKKENARCETLEKSGQILATIVMLLIIFVYGDMSSVVMPVLVATIIYTIVATEEN